MDAVVESAAALFLKRGIENVAMTEIAKDAGIGVASLYRYFRTKTAIVTAAGILQWDKVCALFRETLEQPSYQEKTGFGQIRELLGLQLVLYREHKDFLQFLYEFDAFMRKEQVPKEALSDYERSIMNLYPWFEKAYRKGVEDGTVRGGLDFPLLYRSLSHALMSACQRFIAGEILPGDDYSAAEQELNMVITLALDWVRTK